MVFTCNCVLIYRFLIKDKIIKKDQRILNITASLVLQDEKVGSYHSCLIQLYQLVIQLVVNNHLYYLQENQKVYQLRSVIIHSGMTMQSGHYSAFVLNSNNWFRIDDNQVQLQTNNTLSDILLSSFFTSMQISKVTLNTVLKSQAYILFYEEVDGSRVRSLYVATQLLYN